MRFSMRRRAIVPFPKTQLERESGLRRCLVFIRQMGVREEPIYNGEVYRERTLIQIKISLFTNYLQIFFRKHAPNNLC